jgi:hypothetical protein
VRALGVEVNGFGGEWRIGGRGGNWWLNTRGAGGFGRCMSGAGGVQGGRDTEEGGVVCGGVEGLPSAESGALGWKTPLVAGEIHPWFCQQVYRQYA